MERMSGPESEPPRAAVSGELDLTVVLPYFNPGSALRKTLEDTVGALRGTGQTFEVIAVSDGSTDGSERSIEGLYPEDLVHVVLPGRRGKGQALRSGFAGARGRYIGFIDADGDIPPRLLAGFADIVRSSAPDVVIGSKRHPDSKVVYPVLRRLYSWAYQQVVRFAFGLRVTDTQAGIKLVRREVLADVLPRTVVEGFAFDLELLVLAERLGYSHVVEAPIEIGRRFSSTISPRALVETLAETAGIWWRLHVTHRYRLSRQRHHQMQRP
jgi:glycosyltransferase involved in cell wall biosynthesis